MATYAGVGMMDVPPLVLDTAKHPTLRGARTDVLSVAVFDPLPMVQQLTAFLSTIRTK